MAEYDVGIPSKRPPITSVTLERDYPALRILGASLITFGLAIGFVGYQLRNASKDSAAERRPTPVVSYTPLFLAGAGCVVAGLGLVGAAWRFGVRYLATADGVTCESSRTKRKTIRWRDVRRIRLPDARQSVVIEPAHGEPLELHESLSNFAPFLGLLRRVVDLESLAQTEAPPASPDVTELGLPRQPTSMDERPSLPLCWGHPHGFRLAAFGAVSCVFLSWYVWFRIEIENERGGMLLLARCASPILAAVCVVKMFKAFTKYLVSPDGIEFHSWARTRRFPWTDVTAVRALTTGSEAGRKPPRLQIFFKSALPVELPVGRRIFEIRDAIAAAAAEAGVFLAADRQPSVPSKIGIAGHLARHPLPKSLTIIGGSSGGRHSGDWIRLNARDEFDRDRKIELTERRFDVEKDHAAIRSLPGRLYFDDRLIEIGSTEEIRIVQLLRSASVSSNEVSASAESDAASTPENSRNSLGAMVASLIEYLG